MRFPACYRLVGRCSAILYIAIMLDVVGLVLLLVGICANLSAWDFYIYTGALVIALSSLFWLFWHMFNIEVSFKEFAAGC